MIENRNLTEPDIYHILSNPRRREALRHLGENGGKVDVGELSTDIAAAETGERPPPTNVRDSVYTSLHQVHLPTLEELGVLTYDRETRTVHRRVNAREIDAYMDVVTPFGITWEGIYRTLGTVALIGVVASAADVPGAAATSPLVWGTIGLVAIAVTSTYQLWRYRRSVIGLLFG